MADPRPSVTLVLVVHDHQPVGNFDGVFEQSADDAYEPFLAFLEAHPRVRLALHTSGPLLQWFATHRRGYLERLRVLVDRDQVEPWGGGFFEPVLISIPENDRRGQIHAMADWIELELGRRPRGLWLTERVWEPGLAGSLAAAGVEYTAVDDAHFVAAGLRREQLWGTWRTEDQGQALQVFPIHRELRYAIPFAEPEETIALLRRIAAGGEGRLAVLGDDGEKFGVWPGTRSVCYEQGWLERFAAAIEANPWIKVRTPAEAIAELPPLGLIYLPTASYHEMGEWALPAEGQDRYERAAEQLEEVFADEAHDLLRGGIWRNFQSRYAEANRMHKRALRASRALWRRADPDAADWKQALNHLWRAQCNDAYWHGVFGGLYLPHLRSAVYRELIAVESFLGNGAVGVERADLDLDGREDALLQTAGWAAWVGARGGALWGFDDRRRRCNYGDTLARRPEFYHRRLKDATVGVAEGQTIHQNVRLKEPGLAALVESYDARGRESFLDRWIEDGADRDWSLETFTLAAAVDTGIVVTRTETQAPALEKRFVAGPDALEVHYQLGSSRPCTGTLEIEVNLGLHVPRADDRYVEIDGAPADPPHFAARASHAGVKRAAFVDRWADRRLTLETDRPAALERAPIETVSLSESGAERVFQGLEVRYRFPVSLQPGQPWRLRFRLVPDGAGNPAASPRP